jgi:hypothetical protein
MTSAVLTAGFDIRSLSFRPGTLKLSFEISEILIMDFTESPKLHRQLMFFRKLGCFQQSYQKS